ncbi:hypothetical protein HWQ46_26690 [Shewanella sp. D64]|uniref:hypothetical protein n=1 Tax=unclassified Shewanella TaxID=196818 RepID=UPI0022BA25AF|nr:MULTISPECIES: hypothetical protein [unclassified Shewanella]MEC4729097.1 hypothetical protein [Shewanella sp. D64]MEC4737334.1 hypothetical protein [Shewanella sp. E94]WBJ97160.1 hypothetical protein HWQ47_08690 [Shewanella sp. MTB7]
MKENFLTSHLMLLFVLGHGEKSEKFMFAYLDEDDRKEFEHYLGTDLEDMLVSGSRTNRRLECYLDQSEFFKFRLILTALVKDFNFPCVRFTSALALTIYSVTMESSCLQKNMQDIVLQELGFI